MWKNDSPVLASLGNVFQQFKHGVEELKRKRMFNFYSFCRHISVNFLADEKTDSQLLIELRREHKSRLTCLFEFIIHDHCLT